MFVQTKTINSGRIVRAFDTHKENNAAHIRQKKCIFCSCCTNHSEGKWTTQHRKLCEIDVDNGRCAATAALNAPASKQTSWPSEPVCKLTKTCKWTKTNVDCAGGCGISIHKNQSIFADFFVVVAFCTRHYLQNAVQNFLFNRIHTSTQHVCMQVWLLWGEFNKFPPHGLFTRLLWFCWNSQARATKRQILSIFSVVEIFGLKIYLPARNRKLWVTEWT